MERIALGSIALLLTTAPLVAQTPTQKIATVRYLQKLQNKDGGFRATEKELKSTLRATSSSLRALKYFDGAPLNKDGVIAFVKSCHDKASGGFADVPGGKPAVMCTAVGIMALLELDIKRAPYEAGAVKFLADNAKSFEDIRIAVAGLEAIGVKSTQNAKWMEQVFEALLPGNTVDDPARHAGGAIVALLRMGFMPQPEALQNTLTTLNEGQRADGGYGKRGAMISDLESTYRVMRCFHMLKEKPKNAERVREFVAKCRRPDGGYGLEPGAMISSASATYFASIILHWLDDK